MKWQLAALAVALVVAAAPRTADARTVMASCWTYSDAPEQFRTTIAPITIDDVTINSGEEADLIKRAARGAMEANGLPKGKDFSCSFYRPGDRANSPNSQSDIQYGIDHPKEGTRVVRIDGFVPAGPTPTAPAPPTNPIGSSWYCDYVIEDRSPPAAVGAVVTTPLAGSEVGKKWGDKAVSEGATRSGCWGHSKMVSSQDKVVGGSVQEAEEMLVAAQRNQRYVWSRTNWQPNEAGPRSQLQTAIVTLAAADPAKGERGFSGLAFSIEYQFLVCQGELHIAYSLLEDSVRQRPGTFTPPVYAFGGERHIPTAIPSHIVSVPITGTVSTRSSRLIGTFGDNFASKSLGFGCFTGQTKKLGNMKDYLPENASETQVQDFLHSLEAFIKTTEIYQSAEAEDEINRFLREHPGEKTMDLTSAQHFEQVSADKARARKAEEESREDERQTAAAAASRRKEEIARENAERQAEYNRQLEEHQKAVEENNRQVAAAAEAQRQYEAGKVEYERKVAEAHQVAEEQRTAYERQRAAWEAEVNSGKYAVPPQGFITPVMPLPPPPHAPVRITPPMAVVAPAPARLEPPPSGGGTRFYYRVGMVPRADDQRNQICVSTPVTLPESFDRNVPGSRDRAQARADAYRAAFLEKCARLRQIDGAPVAVIEGFDSGWPYPQWPNDGYKVVSLP